MKKRLLACAATLSLVARLGAADPEESPVDPLFTEDTVLEVRIEAPFDHLTVERPDEEDLPARFSYTSASGNAVSQDIKIRVRGRLRATKEACSFPPLRLDFKKSKVEDTLFADQDKLKLVTHCRNRDDQYEQSVVAEYLAYRIYNLLTDVSFRARLLRATYASTDGGPDFEAYAFAIESKDRLAKRLRAKALEIESARIEDLDPVELNLGSVFQYLIGNTDFSPFAAAPGQECCHNYELFARENEPILSVPYDFDQAGLVDAPYAAPDPRFKLHSTRERLYRGRCANNDYLPATLALFREKRAAIEALIGGQEGLHSKTRKRMLNFIASFYRTIDDPKRVTNYLVNRCV